MAFVRISEPMAAKRDACLAALDVPRENGLHLYAVIDLAASTDATYWLAKLRCAQACNLFEQQPEAAAEEVAPWLLRIDTDDAQISLRHTVDEGLVAWNVSWVQSTLTLRQLAARLSRRLTANIANGEALFRYYDPRLFPNWWANLSDSQRRHFGAFGTRWWTLDPAGSLLDIDLVGASIDDPCPLPWQPTLEEQNVLAASSDHQQLVSFLGKRQPDTFLDKQRGEQWRFVRMHDLQARTRHVVNLADRLRYCELALRYGDDFAEQPHWQAAWAAMASGDRRLADVVEPLQGETMPSSEASRITT